MLPEISLEDFAESLDAVAQELLARAGEPAPPIDALAVAQACGLSVAYDDRQSGRARLVRLADADRPQGSILLRPDPRGERRQWAIAHELGEHSAHEVFARLGINPHEAGRAARESVANSLAGRILTPTHSFAGDAAGCGWDLVELKQRYQTASHELIARRMLDFPPQVTITIFDQNRLTFRRSNVPLGRRQLHPAETACLELVRSTERPSRHDCQPAAVQGWPVYEAEWRREILRTEWNPDAWPE